MILLECVFNHVLRSVANHVYSASFHRFMKFPVESLNRSETDRKNGIISQLTRVLVGLYEEPERPANAWVPSRGHR